jgi:hypothetical protein
MLTKLIGIFLRPILRRKIRVTTMNHLCPDESRERLHRAGWSIGETATATSWIVTGVNGENGIQAQGASQAEAWHRAVEQAAAVGMAGRSRT